MRTIGTQAKGIRTPIIRPGDDVAQIVLDSILLSSKEEGFSLNDRDVVAVTEAIIARGQSNYATLGQISADVRTKLGGGHIGVVFPILSRNRFSYLLRGIAGGASKVTVLLSYPSDEVGNPIITREELYDKGIGMDGVYTEAEWVAIFGEPKHPFTQLNYLEYYRSLGDNIEIMLSNDPRSILSRTKNVIACDIHTRDMTKRLLKKAGADVAIGLDDLLTSPVDGSGYNPMYGLLGSNIASDDRVKLFPHSCDKFVESLSTKLCEATGKNIECLVYGDGAFKDPAFGIWELADPVSSPAFTEGLDGTPNELKLKYLADNRFANMEKDEMQTAVTEYIRQKNTDMGKSMETQGTTPRRIYDLLASLSDLISGSGDKGTPVVLIQSYFDDYSKE